MACFKRKNLAITEHLVYTCVVNDCGQIDFRKEATSMSTVYQFPYDSPVRYLPLVYMLPPDLLSRFPTLRRLPRSMGALNVPFSEPQNRTGDYP